MPEIISVFCIDSIDPPMIVITIAGTVPLVVSSGIYELIRTSLGLPENPCAGLGN